MLKPSMRFWTWPTIKSYQILPHQLHVWLFVLPIKFHKSIRQQLFNKLLTHYHPHPYQITTNAQGKPYMLASPLQFNISHSQNLLMIGLQMHQPLGLDLEFIKPRDIHHFAQRFWGNDWDQNLKTYPPYLRRLGFYHAWTQTEAWVKYHGASVFRYPPFTPNCFPLPLQKKIKDFQVLSFMPRPNVLASICTSSMIQEVLGSTLEIKNQDDLDKLLRRELWY